MNIQKLRELMQDGENRAFAHLDVNKLFEWVHPKYILGVNKVALTKMNHSLLLLDLDSSSAERGSISESLLENDDYLIAEYLEECVSQRNSLATRTNGIEKISTVVHLESLLYLLVEYETKINFCDLDRASMKYVDYDQSLKIIESMLSTEPRQHIRKYLVEFAHFMFCYLFVSPELATLPELQLFLREKDNRKRLDNLEHLKPINIVEN